MSYTVKLVAGPDVSAGFAVAGLTPVQARDGPAAVMRLAELMREPAVGVILIEDRLYHSLPGDLLAQFARRPLPIVVPFPGPRWAADLGDAEAYIVELLRRAIGYRVKLA